MVEKTFYNLRELTNIIYRLLIKLQETSGKHDTTASIPAGGKGRMAYNAEILGILAELEAYMQKAHYSVIGQIGGDVATLIGILKKQPQLLRTAGERAVEGASEGKKLLGEIQRSRTYFSRSNVNNRRIGRDARNASSGITNSVNGLRQVIHKYEQQEKQAVHSEETQRRAEELEKRRIVREKQTKLSDGHNKRSSEASESRRKAIEERRQRKTGT